MGMFACPFGDCRGCQIFYVELVDDVGGISGFCEMLRTICECDMNNKEKREERENILDWAYMMGWTGRNISPKQTL